MNINDVWKCGRLHAELTAAAAALDTLNIVGGAVLSHEEIMQIRATQKVIFSALDRVASKMSEAENDFESLLKIANHQTEAAQ